MIEVQVKLAFSLQIFAVWFSMLCYSAFVEVNFSITIYFRSTLSIYSMYIAIYFQRAGKKTNGLIIDIPQVVMGEAIKKTLETSIDVGQHPVLRILR